MILVKSGSQIEFFLLMCGEGGGDCHSYRALRYERYRTFITVANACSDERHKVISKMLIIFTFDLGYQLLTTLSDMLGIGNEFNNNKAVSVAQLLERRRSLRPGSKTTVGRGCRPFG
jgi:hypothetical protein